MQRPVHRAFVGDLHEARPLLLAELALELDLAGDVVDLSSLRLAVGAVLRVDLVVPQPHDGALQWPLLALGVHAQGDHGTGTQRRGQEIVRGGACILAAEFEGTGVRVLAVDPGEMDTLMHAAAIPEADPQTLARPETIAERIVDMIERPAAAPSGARLVAPDWQLQQRKEVSP